MSEHLPVLLEEVLELLAPQSGELFLDATFGGGGHSARILQAGANLVAIDRDPAAEARAKEFQAEWGERFSFRRLNFEQLGELTEPGFDGILLDIGVSSFQLNEGERGFSFRIGRMRRRICGWIRIRGFRPRNGWRRLKSRSWCGR